MDCWHSALRTTHWRNRSSITSQWSATELELPEETVARCLPRAAQLRETNRPCELRPRGTSVAPDVAERPPFGAVEG